MHIKDLDMVVSKVNLNIAFKFNNYHIACIRININ